MLTVLACLTLGHDPRLVGVAIIICAAGSILSMRLLARVRRHSGSRQHHLLFLAALVAGGAVWTTHFSAMLAYELPIQRAFDPTLTIASLFFAVLFSWIGFYLTTRTRLGPMVEVGGMIFGLGIVVMHYAGMRAFLVPGTITFDPQLVVASIFCGCFFGAVASNRIGRPITRFCKYGGSLAMGLAIVSTHFTAMGAMTVTPMAGVEIPAQALSNSFMLGGVVSAIAVIMTMAFSAYMIDMHAAREAGDRFQHLALHDPLTGLPNRHNLSIRLEDLLAANHDDTARIALLVIDLDRFKDVNDVHGHAAGDVVLRSIAQSLASALGPNEFLARIGGDEFVAVKSDIFARGEALKFASRLRDVILDPVDWEHQKLSVGCSIGVALYPDHDKHIRNLLPQADLAMYRAKSLGRGKICTYEEGMNEASRSRAALAIDLKRAIADGEFELHYQPQNDANTRLVLGFEALLRWNHPQRGRVSPADFIPIAEETGLIIEIGDWVLRTACAAAKGWSEPHKVAVNIAPLQLAQGDLPRRVAEILCETGLSADRLEIEITESGIIADHQHALMIVQQLKVLGVTVAMDDFGTGYSSLSTLQQFPFDKIKIDRTFITHVTTNAHSAAIVQATLLLGKSLGIPILAEGVETEAHLAFLCAAGCNSVQGFLFGKPIAAVDVERLLAESAGSTSVAINGTSPEIDPAKVASVDLIETRAA